MRRGPDRNVGTLTRKSSLGTAHSFPTQIPTPPLGLIHSPDVVTVHVQFLPYTSPAISLVTLRRASPDAHHGPGNQLPRHPLASPLTSSFIFTTTLSCNYPYQLLLPSSRTTIGCEAHSNTTSVRSPRSPITPLPDTASLPRRLLSHHVSGCREWFSSRYSSTTGCSQDTTPCRGWPSSDF
jgi:hypothetical protein